MKGKRYYDILKTTIKIGGEFMKKEMQKYTLETINDYIYALRIPFEDIFTTVYFVKTEQGTLLFDTASNDCAVENAIIPAFHQLGVSEDGLKYIFISHSHDDHAGGLRRLLAYYPNACVVSRSETLRETFASYKFLSPQEDEVLLDNLRVVFLTGHTQDSATIYDKRTKTLISGDSIQLYGVFGSGDWGSNVSFVKEYVRNIQNLRNMDIDAILTAHNFHPYGRMFFGKLQIASALDACLAPFAIIKKLIDEFPDADDETICKQYNSQGNLPTLGCHVIKSYREETL